jgi:hypothetical protein
MFGSGFAIRGEMGTPGANAQTASRVFELRTYTAQPGKLEALKARFRDQAISQFTKHGLMLVGFWAAADAPNSENTVVYLLAHPSREAAKKNWDDWRQSPERAKMFAEGGGRFTKKIESMFLEPVDFSPLR